MHKMLDLIGNANLEIHTSIVLTYAFDFTLYDGLICRSLERSGIRNQIVLCDLECYDAGLRETETFSRLGRKYSVTPIHQAGAFHPKIYLFLGSRCGRLLVGSGNTTVGGLMRNAELFGMFSFDGADGELPHPAFSQCFELAVEVTKKASPAVAKQMTNASQATPWLAGRTAGDSRELLIGGQGRKPLYEQIRDHLPTGRADGVVICSSSFDRRLKGLQNLAALSRSKPVCIVQAETVALDGKVVAELGNQVHWRPFIDPQSPKGSHPDGRAHAKLFVFRHGTTETCVFGSANALEPALNSVNPESGVKIAISDLDRFQSVNLSQDVIGQIL